MDSWERVQLIMEREGFNKNSFSETIGLNNNVTITRLINEKRSASPNTCKKIVDRFPQYSYEWLLRGKEPMLDEKFSLKKAEAAALNMIDELHKINEDNKIPRQQSDIDLIKYLRDQLIEQENTKIENQELKNEISQLKSDLAKALSELAETQKQLLNIYMNKK